MIENFSRSIYGRLKAKSWTFQPSPIAILLGIFLIQLLVPLGSLFLLGFFLNRNALGMGVDFMQRPQATFPAVAFCYYSYLGKLGPVVEGVQCTLTLNAFYSRLFVMLWAWLLFSSVSSFLFLLDNVIGYILQLFCRKPFVDMLACVETDTFIPGCLFLILTPL